jgi:hypothetical protein
MVSTGKRNPDRTDITNAIRIAQTYDRRDWNYLPGQWLMYCMLLALPFPEKVVCAPIASQFTATKLLAVPSESIGLTGDPRRPTKLCLHWKGRLPLLPGRVGATGTPDPANH